MKNFCKTFLMMIIMICVFGYIGVANAATDKLSSVEDSNTITAASNLLTGKDLSTADKSTITTLEGKYTLYYKYAKISSDVYDKYKSGDSSASTTIAGLIKDPADADELENDWNKVSGTQILYNDPDFVYDAENPTGYVIALMALSSDNKIYTYKNVYQLTSATTFATYASIAKGAEVKDEEVQKEETVEKTDEEEDVDTEEEPEAEEAVEKSTENPETGISDVAIYLVPLAITLGSALYLRRRNA